MKTIFDLLPDRDNSMCSWIPISSLRELAREILKTQDAVYFNQPEDVSSFIKEFFVIDDAEWYKKQLDSEKRKSQ